MKKIGLIVLAALLVCAMFAGCSKNEENNTNETQSTQTVQGKEEDAKQKKAEEGPDQAKKLKVVTTIFPQYDFVREIAGEGVELSMLLPPGSESHSYEPTPQDIIKIQESDLFIYVGGESDEWVDRILSSMENADLKKIALMECVDVVEEEVVAGMQEDAEHSHSHQEEEHEHSEEESHSHSEEEEHSHLEEEHVELDEHVWTSPKNAKKIVQQISNELQQLDSANAQKYAQNTENYINQLEEIDSAFEEVVKNSTKKTMVFGDRFPLRYFADAYGLTYYAAFPGCSSETEASAKTVAFLIDKVKEEKIPAVFHIEFSNEQIADAISEATGVKKLLFHSCHNVSPDEIRNGTSYIDLMKKNVETLKEALV